MENNLTPPDRARRVADVALDAFWQVVADAFPGAKTGDLSPLAMVGLETAAQTAVREWAGSNATPPGHCATCGSEIVAAVNDSLFSDGECGGCEYRRYRSQPALLGACHEALGFVRSWEKTNGLAGPCHTRRALEHATALGDGHAA